MTKEDIKHTPMIEQYLKIKEDYADALVFFRLGDFYEMFFDDAITASKVLEITLTSRSNSKIPMAGVPYHSVKPYIFKLIEHGYKIAIAEQVTEPGKGLVEREVTRLITPGTVFEDDFLNSANNNFIASLILTINDYLLTVTDISTGESFLYEGLNKKEAINEIVTLSIKELILTNKSDIELINELEKNNIYITIHKNINKHDNKWAKDLNVNQKEGARHLINYLTETQKQPINHLEDIKVREHKNYLKVDYLVKKQLEILESNTNNPKTTLFYHINNTHTTMGMRLLKHELSYPITNVNELNNRYDHIDAFSNIINRKELIDLLSQIYDINRILSKISFKSANARDLYQLKETLKLIKPLKEVLIKYNNELIDEMIKDIKIEEELIDLLEKSIVDEPPFTIREGGIIKKGYNEKLDYLLDINKNSKKWLEDFEIKERERLNVKNLKVGYNKVFGYYIEISKAQALELGDNHDYERRQTLTNSERYISSELKEKEDEILNAKEKAINLEYELFTKIREKTEEKIYDLQILSKIIAKIDVYLSHKITSEKNNYTRPLINTENRKVNIINGRHPVVEKFTKYIKNDLVLNDNEIFLITGPNMSGKSTYMRMMALIVYMAQTGSFVPADSALLPIYDQIFTRIGSSDDLSGGKSTFMVEMTESNEALTYATEKSLIIFDEIGRGTATFDGMALAQGMIEYIATKIKAQTFFSTHYHELTKLEEKYDNIVNMHVRAKEENNKMIFLHQVKKGSSDKSYGLQVAALANLPKSLLKRSEEILKQLENKKIELDIDLFNYENYEKDIVEYSSPLHDELVMELENLNINELTPVEALIFLSNLKNKISK